MLNQQTIKVMIKEKSNFKILRSYKDEQTGLTINVYDSVSEETKDFIKRKMKHSINGVYNSHNTDNGFSFNFNV